VPADPQQRIRPHLQRKAERAKRIWVQRLGGQSAGALAAEFGVTERTIRRIFRKQALSATGAPEPLGLVLNLPGEEQPRSAVPAAAIRGDGDLIGQLGQVNPTPGAGPGAGRQAGPTAPAAETASGTDLGHLTAQLQEARAHWDAGRRQEAIAQAGQVAVSSALLLGDLHPRTLAIRADLAVWRGQAGDMVGAVEGLEAVLTGRMVVLGRSHAVTLATRVSLGRWRKSALAATIATLTPSRQRRFGSRAKLNEDQISTIRNRYLGGESASALASEFGVNHTTIRRAITGIRR
jgi:hypothetical protein